MLEHDFAGAEMQSAVMTLTRIHDYEWRAIKRSRRWEPPLPEVVDSGGRSADKGAQKNDE